MHCVSYTRIPHTDYRNLGNNCVGSAFVVGTLLLTPKTFETQAKMFYTSFYCKPFLPDSFFEIDLIRADSAAAE